MRKTIAAAGLAASMTGGALMGAVLGAPSLVGAQEETAERAGWVQDALAGLVSDGTLTTEQAEAVEEALIEARPERHGPGWRHAVGSVVAEAIGITEEELRAGLAEGRTIAEIAEEAGVDRQVVIDALVDAAEARLAEAVENGRLTQERADALADRVEERATGLVDREPPLGRHGRGGGPFGGPPAADDAPGDTTS